MLTVLSALFETSAGQFPPASDLAYVYQGDFIVPYLRSASMAAIEQVWRVDVQPRPSLTFHASQVSSTAVLVRALIQSRLGDSSLSEALQVDEGEDVPRSIF